MNRCLVTFVAALVASLAANASASTVLLNLDANNIAGITGSAVNTWNDSSGNGYNATAVVAGASAAPTLQLNGLNGQSIVNFAGSRTAGDSMVVNVASGPSQPYSVFVVGQILGNDIGNSNSTDYLFDGVGPRVALGINSSGSNQNDLFAYAGGGSTVDYATTIPGSGYHIFEVVYNGVNSKLYVDGTLQASGDPGADTLGALRIGARTNIAEFLNGSIATLAAYTDGASPLTAAERNLIGSNLQTKYGLTGAYVAAPEPASWLLLAGGLFGLITIRSRGRRTSR